MIQQIMELYGVTTWYELRMLVGAIIIVTLVFAVYNYYQTRSKRLTGMPIVTMIAALILPTLTAFMVQELFGKIGEGFLQSGVMMVFLIGMLNTLSYVLDYSAEFRDKKFDPDHVNRRHFNSTLNGIVMLIILGTSFGFFSPTILGQTLIVVSVGAIFVLALNHLYVFRMIRDSK